jgi:MFS family permease
LEQFDRYQPVAGTAGGIVHFLGQTASMLAPTVTGLLVSHYGYNAAFALGGAVCLTSVVYAGFVRFDIERQHQPAALAVSGNLDHINGR